MMHSTLSRRSRQTQLVVLAGAALALGLVSGCGDSGEAQAAVKKSGRSFNALAVGDANASPGYSETQYKDTEQALSKHAGDATGFAEAAAVGIAAARKGQAALASQRAVQAENIAMHRARVIRGMISEWLTMSAIAHAAGQFDPSDDISEIEGIIAMRQDDIASYRSKMEQINEEIARFESQIADLRGRAREQSNEAGALELQIPRVSAQQAAELAQQAREFTLRSDQYELEATRIEGIVGQLRPGAREVSLNVEKARSQIELLEMAVDELRERARASQQDAQQARERAQQSAQRINDAVADYQAFRDNDVQSANEEAISLVRSAINALRDARYAVKQVADLNKADAQQMLAEFAMRQSGGEREEAMLYMALKDAKISGDWDPRIQAANQHAAELKQMGQQAYLDAAASLRSARARGDTAERIEATAKRLETLGGVEPEPVMSEPMDQPDELDLDELDELSPQALADMSFDEIIAMMPEDIRDMVAQQLQGTTEMLATIDDTDMLFDLIEQLDEQAQGMPEEVAAGFEFVKRQIQNRIDEIESDG